MPWSSIARFSDPEACEQAILDVAGIWILPTTRGIFNTKVTKVRFDRLLMQRLEFSLPQIITCEHPSDRQTISFVTEPSSSRSVYCGVEFSAGDIIVNRSDVMHWKTDAGHRCGSVSLPRCELNSVFRAVTGYEFPENNDVRIVRPDPALMPQLLQLHILGHTKHSARRSWVYIDGENFMGARADIAGDPNNPDVSIAWKYLWTAKDTWLGPEQNLGSIGALYNLTMDPFEKYDMIFNGAMSARMPMQSPGKYAGQDNGWAAALIFPVVMEFNKSVVDFPSIKRSPGGASNDWRPDLQRPDNPVPLLDMKKPPNVTSLGGD